MIGYYESANLLGFDGGVRCNICGHLGGYGLLGGDKRALLTTHLRSVEHKQNAYRHDLERLRVLDDERSQIVERICDYRWNFLPQIKAAEARKLAEYLKTLPRGYIAERHWWKR